MKTKFIIGGSAIASVLIAGSALASSHHSEKMVELKREDVIVNPVVITTTTTSTTTTIVVDTLPSEVIDQVNSQIENGETLTVDELRAKYGQCGEWHDLAIDVGWPEEQWKKLSYVIWKESRCTVDAWNGQDAGLTQINRIHTEWLASMGLKHPDDMFNPRLNLEFAFKLWSSREEKGLCGWKPWSVSCK
jgi:hypothetical protein